MNPLTSIKNVRRMLLFILPALLLLVAAFGVSRYRQVHLYDDLIAKISSEYAVDPKLVKAVIWRESGFKKNRRGKHGEIGLMQVTSGAAGEWAAARGISEFKTRELFDPETNIQAGAWYLKRSISYWSGKQNPLPYALAEYNAGRSNAVRWAADDGNDANKFWNNITYPLTKRYVHDVLSRYRRYH